jgi:outer membrane murein-binding lipoprotein Lpp
MPPVLAGHRRPAPWLALLAAGTLLLSACGSAGTVHASTAVKDACQQVSAVLSDGPDPGADPVGYAEAQINPLRQVSTQDASLRAAVDALSAAYQQFFSSNGAAAAKQAVSRASHRVDAICPGATS